MEENKSGALKIVAPVATLIIGVVVGFMFGSGQSNPETVKLQAQIEAAKKIFPPIPEMRSISGKVLSVSGNTMTIESITSMNPFETLPKERVVTITSATKLVSLEQKDQASFQKEMTEFSKKISSVKPGDTAQTTPTMPPMPFNEKTVSLSDIKVGEMVNIEANENIKDQASFIATKITTTPTPSMPATPQTPAI